MPDSAPLAFHLLAKPTGATCNLDCQYCFFLSKEALYPGSHFRMADQLLETYIKQLLKAHPASEVAVAWQGGEPTLMGLDFFRRSVELVEKHKKPNQTVAYSLQTNGTKLDDDWCSFFREHNFLIGLSVDGPPELHNAYRVSKGGQGTFDQVKRGWECLKAHQVQFNVLCTVHAANANHSLRVYRFFRDELGAMFIQFIPIVERVTPDLLSLTRRGWGNSETGKRPLYTQAGRMASPRSVKPKQYGNFLITVFEEWVRRDVGKVFVQMFDVALAAWVGERPGLCVFQETCGRSLALEHNGDLYSCDHYVEQDHLLGNINETHLSELVSSDKQRQFGAGKRDALPRVCRECDLLFACHGGCPRNRFLTPPTDGASQSSRLAPRPEHALNYLCAGYKMFFNHVDQPMRLMASLLRERRAPAEIMRWYAVEDLHRAQAIADAQPNDPCPCGSGRKLKRCHGRRGTEAIRVGHH